MTDPTTPDLLPCPFCGGEATFEKQDDALGNLRWTVGCNETDEDTEGSAFAILCYGYQSLTTFATKREAAAAWNRRAPAAPTGWRPIATAPKDGNPIWCYVAGYQTSLTWCNGAWRNLSAWGRFEEWSPTHWVPLPAAPSPTTGPAAAAEESPSGGKPKIS